MAPEAAAATMILPVHRLTPYLRARVSMDDRSLTIDHERSLIGLIPVWTTLTQEVVPAHAGTISPRLLAGG